MSRFTKHTQSLILMLFALYALAPVYLVLLASMRSEAELFNGPLSLPWPIETTNYVRVWTESGFSAFFFNSLKISVAVTILILLTAPLAGYAFAKMQFRGREPLFALFLAGLVVPAPSVIVALYGNLQFLGLIDTHIGVILPQAALLMPFSVFMMRTVMQEVPDELIEASTMDGANPLYGFLTVVVPLARPGLMSLTLIVFMFSWQEYLLPLVVLQILSPFNSQLRLSLMQRRHPRRRRPFSHSPSLISERTLSFSMSAQTACRITT